MFYVIKIFVFFVFFINATTFYNIFYNTNFKLWKCCLENVNINIDKSHTSLCLTNVFLFGLICFFLSQDSLHARLNSHCKAWSYKKKKHKKIKSMQEMSLERAYS